MPRGRCNSTSVIKLNIVIIHITSRFKISWPLALLPLGYAPVRVGFSAPLLDDAADNPHCHALQVFD